MADSQDPGPLKVSEPDPNYRQFPIPRTVDEVVARIVEFVQQAVHDEGGAAYRFEVNAAQVDFKEHWGPYVGQQLTRFPDNPWPDQWKNVVHIAKRHAKHAVARAKAAHRKQVSREDFVEGGHLAAKECGEMFGRDGKALGCWCNDCFAAKQG